MKKLFLIILGVVLSQGIFIQSVMAENGLITKKSVHNVEETLNRLESVLKKKGITVFARINHKKNANGVQLILRPTEVLIFGNPKMGTHFVNSKQTAGIDLPMKALAWEDEQGQTWLTYNDPTYIADRHGIDNRPQIISKMQGALNKLTNKAVSP